MQLEVENQSSEKDYFGISVKTSVFTGGEELNGNNEGVKNTQLVFSSKTGMYSLSLQQQTSKRKIAFS